MIDVGFKNFVVKHNISSILKPYTIKSKRLIKEAKLNNKLIDCTHGGKIGVLLLLDTRHLILSPLKYSSLTKRFTNLNSNIEENKVSPNCNKI